MVSLSTPGGPAARLQSQIGEAVAEIASVDFPERWPNLLDVSTATSSDVTPADVQFT